MLKQKLSSISCNYFPSLNLKYLLWHIYLRQNVSEGHQKLQIKFDEIDRNFEPL
jgi:hypothetical protein